MEGKTFKKSSSQHAQKASLVRWNNHDKQDQNLPLLEDNLMHVEQTYQEISEPLHQQNNQLNYGVIQHDENYIQIGNKILTPNTLKYLPTIQTYERQKRKVKFQRYRNLNEQDITQNLYQQYFSTTQVNESEFSFQEKQLDENLEDDNEYLQDQNYFPEENKEQSNLILQLARIINLVLEIQKHSQKCQYQLQFNGISIQGLYFVLKFTCNHCRHTIELSNSEISQNPTFKNQMVINLQCLIASLSCGLGYTLSREFFALLGIQYYSKTSYYKLLDILGSYINQKSAENIEQNLEEEIRISQNKQQIDQQTGKVLLSVIGDCSWGKRSYGHGYTSKTGCAVLIGKETQQIIFLDTKIKGETWNNTSTGMESALIKDGFQQIYQRGAYISEYIADADSNTFKCIKLAMPNGPRIKKIDRANHAARNFRTHLENWKKTYKNTRLGNTPKWRNDYMGLVRKIMSKASTDPEYFSFHIKNSLSHMSGNHVNCDKFYCTEPSKLPPLNFSQESVKFFEQYLVNFSNRAEKISDKQTSNLAECYFSVLSRYLNGKCLNLTKGSNYSLRTKIAALCFNKGPNWNMAILNDIGFSNNVVQNYFQDKQCKHSYKVLYKQSQIYKEKRKKKKFHLDEDDNREYGQHNEEFVQQCEEELWEQCYKFYDENVIIDIDRQDQIFYQTIDQSDSDVWSKERFLRITASNIRRICILQKRTKRSRVVYSIAYPPDLSNNLAIQHGKRYESEALDHKLFSNDYQISKSGLIVCLQYPFLGASPDGLLQNKKTGKYDAVIEVKCPYNARDFTQQEVQQDINKTKYSEKTLKFLDFDKQKNQIVIKKQHDYYYQVQTQLFVTNLEKAYFIVYFTNHQHRVVVEVPFDKQFFTEMVLDKVEDFYFQYYLPEISETRKLMSKPFVSFTQDFSQTRIYPQLSQVFQEEEEEQQYQR